MPIWKSPFKKGNINEEGSRFGSKGVAIIIAAALALAGVSFFWQQADFAKRDKARISGLKEVREALFSYYNENGHYPSSVSDWDPDKLDYGAGVKTGANDYDNLASLISHILPRLPKDPLNKANSPTIDDRYLYRYVASSNGRDFAIVYETEDPNDRSPMIMKGW